MSESGYWLVAYAIRSEAATIAVVKASSEHEAKERAVALEQEHDSFMVPYLKRKLEAEDPWPPLIVMPINGEIWEQVDAPH